MQTFLPFSDFKLCANVLDKKRLGKQRVESYQILKVLLNLAKPNKNGNIPWSNHPAVKMWKGYELSLYYYTTAIIDKWKSYGYKDTIQEKIDELKNKYIIKDIQENTIINYTNKNNNVTDIYFGINSVIIHPPWLMFNESFHSSHRAALLYKNYEHYKQFNWEEVPKLEYIWPIK